MRSLVADLLADLAAGLREQRMRWYLFGPGLEEDILARAEMHDIDGVTVPVIAVSDLVILKVLAGRPKDRLALGPQVGAAPRCHVAAFPLHCRAVLGRSAESRGAVMMA